MQPRRLTTNISYAPSGSLIHQVSFVSPMPVATDGTQVLLAGSPPLPVDYAFATVWASVIAIKGSELLKADAFDQVLHITVTCRYLAGLEEDMTVSWDGRVFQIEYIEDPDGRKFEHRVYCTESGTNG